MIAVYNDNGVYSESATEAVSFFSLFGKTELISAKQIISNKFKNYKLLIMPGGSSPSFYSSLGEKGNENICNFVSNGASYLGICAGAYYASNKFEFNFLDSLTVENSSVLSLSDVKAIGPVYKNERLVSIASFLCLFCGGCSFELEKKTKNKINIEARYDSGEPAIISNKFGNGSVILSGIHLEYSTTTLFERNSLYLTLNDIDKLCLTAKKKQDFLSDLISPLIF